MIPTFKTRKDGVIPAARGAPIRLFLLSSCSEGLGATMENNFP